MLILLSPSKTLDFQTPWQVKSPTQPEFLGEAAQLVGVLRERSAKQLAKLMDMSVKLGEENHARFADWSPSHTCENSKPAVLAYQGDVYQGLEAEAFTAADLKFAQTHLRILTGLYGVLRPLDLIQPYRLEMGVPLKTKGAKNLYAFWREKLSASVASAMQQAKTQTLVNLASKEYADAIDFDALGGRVITPMIKEWRGGKLAFLSFFAKKARGLVAAYVIRNRITRPDELKKFDLDGYSFDAERSTENDWLFTRPSVAAKR